ncbi:MAG: hypothetical protein OXI35_10130 [Gemmatimonadota bacterium]|nr:hypothetical protein [Gemmatimonadota bacterium]
MVKDSIDNINRCIEEKTDKIKDRIHLYPEWWLVLPAHKIFTPGSQQKEEWQTVRNPLHALLLGCVDWGNTGQAERRGESGEE